MQAITTRRDGADMHATAGDNSITLRYDDTLKAFDNHAAAAQALIMQLEQFGTYYAGTSGDEIVWVCAEERESFDVREESFEDA